MADRTPYTVSEYLMLPFTMVRLLVSMWGWPFWCDKKQDR